jgi:DNA-directed RNA polymerase specialized sigma24 family protein
MPPLYREVFIARVIEERPSEDVARDQGVNVDTARQQMKRARALLQGILGAET